VGMPAVIKANASLPRALHSSLPASSDPLSELVVAVRCSKDELLSRVLLASRQDLFYLMLSVLL
jgi:hypothetical protein